MPGIELQEISKRYVDGAEAVSNLDLEIAEGEFVILVGPSGCGKSTTLRMVAGLEEISSGELRIDGERVNERAAKDRDIAMVFQNYALYPHMSVRQNMSFALRLAKLPKVEIASRVERAAAILGLEEHLDRKPGKLSGGQRQRVAMGRAIVREPKAFLMDEPLSNLDAKLRVEMRAAVSTLQDRLGTTTLYVTHDQTEAMTLGDRVAVMRDGLLQQFDTPRELYSRPANLFVAGFIGSPAMNFLAAEVAADHLQTCLGPIPLAVEVRAELEDRGAGREVVLGIRPESIEDARFAPREPAGWRFHARIEMTELMGAEIFAYFATDDSVSAAEEPTEELARLQRAAEDGRRGLSNRAIARVDARSPLRADEHAELWLDPREIYIFEAESGEAIAHPPDRETVAIS